MAVPSEIISLIKGIPAGHFDNLLRLVPDLKTLIPKGKNAQEFFVEAITTGDRAKIQALYNPLSLFLAAGGCCGGPVGIVFNSLDAAFCFVLANWLGFVIDILSIVLVFPGVKAGLTGISTVVKTLPKLIGKYAKSSVNIKAMKAIVTRLKKAGEFKEEMLKDLYFMCKDYLNDLVEVQKWIFQSHPKAFELIEKALGKVNHNAMKNANEIGHGVSNIGENMLRRQEEIKRGVDLIQRGMNSQASFARFLFIKPLG